MAGVILDTNVVSEVMHPNGNNRVKEFVRTLDPESTFLSVLTIGEIAVGASLLGDGYRRRTIQAWLDAAQDEYGARLLSIDHAIAKAWGELTGRARQGGHPDNSVDLLIAATAMVHDLVVVTRNVKDFTPTGIEIVNPWDGVA
jgi:predicted nucleic acid-binding protein